MLEARTTVCQLLEQRLSDRIPQRHPAGAPHCRSEEPEVKGRLAAHTHPVNETILCSIFDPQTHAPPS